MGVTFTQVPLVSPGDPVTSTNLAKVAEAINDRLKSGLGDGPRRLIWYFLSQFRQIRNPDSSGYLFPSVAEFFEVYQHIHPSEFEWPVAGPGEFEGARIDSILPAFVFGSVNDDVDSEDVRLAGPEGVALDLGGTPATTPIQRWTLAKLQRGAWDPNTGAMASPSFTAARSVFGIVRSAFGPYGNSYGGFFPTPTLLGDCGDSTPDLPATPSYEIKFTSLVEGVSNKTYSGTCAGVAGNVVAIQYRPDYYVVVSNDGDGNPTVVEYLPTSEWLEGPYTGDGVLRRAPGQFLPRALNYFAAQFRGSDSQRASATGWNSAAFDFQRFLTRQYMLAPARGVEVDGNVVEIYPALWLYGATSFSAGQRFYLRGGTGQQAYTSAEGHTIPALIAYAGGLVGSVTLQLCVNGTKLRDIVLSAGADTSSRIITLDPAIASGSEIYVRLATAMTLADVSESSGVIVEFAELMTYKPLAHDTYAVLRLGGCRIDLANGTDGAGVDESAAYEIGATLMNEGVLINQHGATSPPGSLAEINTNAVFESARRLSKCVRILRRHHLVGYEVENGRSILYFKRFALGDGSEPDFDPSSPPAELEVASGDLVAGESYYVTGTTPEVDYITHDSVDYNPTETFKALNANYTATGDAKVYLVRKYVIPSGTTGSFDAFDGIAPSRTAVAPASIEIGRSYIVRGTGYVTYIGVEYHDGDTFDVVYGSNVFTEHGDVEVFEADGIRHTASPNGVTNEWLVGFDFKVYRDQDTSPWKPEAYSDWMPFSDRCQFYQDWNHQTLDPEARRHFAYGSRIWPLPEAVPGYRYSFNLNKKECEESDDDCKDARRRFYKSCRIYEPFLEIDKAEILIEGEDEIVKVTLRGAFSRNSPFSDGFDDGFERGIVGDGRLHHHENAPANIPRDITQWDRTALHAEDYRTDENAIREYLVKQYYGENCTGGEDNAGVQTGNSALKSEVWDIPSPPFGACYPSIYLVKLIERPYADDNDTQDATDSPMLHDPLLLSELYIRAICEGYVDGETSKNYGCSVGVAGLYDYTFENLCYDAFGGRWFTSLGSSATDYLTSGNIRADKPQGFGPLPNTMAAAEVYNQFAKALNKLTRVRVDIPYTFQTRGFVGYSTQTVSGTLDSYGLPTACSGTNQTAIWTGTAPNPSASTADGDWTDVSFGQSSVTSGFLTTGSPARFDCDGENFQVTSERTEVEYRVAPNDDDIYNAFHPMWRWMFAGRAGVLARISEQYTVLSTAVGDSETGTTCGGNAGAAFPIGDGSYIIFQGDQTIIKDEVCSVVVSGRLTPVAPPSSVVRGCYHSGVDNAAYTGGPGTSVSITPIDGATPFLDVPLS